MFSNYGCHLIFEQFSTQIFKMWYEPKITTKSKENFVSVQVGCLRILVSQRFLPSSLEKLIESLDVMDSNSFQDELLNKKLAYL